MAHVQRFDAIAVLVASLAIVADEYLKGFVRARLPQCTLGGLAPCSGLHLAGPLSLVNTTNAGSALGFAQGVGIWIVLAGLGVCLMPVYIRRLHRFGALAAVAVGLQLGGALGNLADRAVFGGATDMLTFGSTLVWNLADVALAIGTLLATGLLVRTPSTRYAVAAAPLRIEPKHRLTLPDAAERRTS